MEKHFTQFKTLLLLFIMLAVSFSINGQFDKKVLRIKFTESTNTKLKSMVIQKSADGVVRTGIESVDRISEKYKASNMKRVFPHAGKFEAKHRKYGLHLWYEVTIEGADVRLAKDDYAKAGEVKFTELKYHKKRGIKKT